MVLVRWDDLDLLETPFSCTDVLEDGPNSIADDDILN